MSTDKENLDIPFEGSEDIRDDDYLYRYKCPHCDQVTPGQDAPDANVTIYCSNLACQKPFPRSAPRLHRPPVIDEFGELPPGALLEAGPALDPELYRERTKEARHLARAMAALAESVDRMAAAIESAVDNERGR